MIRKEAFTPTVDAFASQRKGLLSSTDARLEPHVRDALRRVGLPSWQSPLVRAAAEVFDEVVNTEADGWTQELDSLRKEFQRELSDTLEKTKKADSAEFDKQVDRITKWVSTMAINAGTEAATSTDPDPVVGLEWVTMEDDKVRASHQEAHGQQTVTGKPFTVGGSELLYPGQPVGDPANWINCRCVVRPAMLGGETMASEVIPTMTGGLDKTAEIVSLTADGVPHVELIPRDDAPEVEAEEAEPEMIPDEEAAVQVMFHGVAAPEGVPSGDGRGFAIGALTNRPLPIPMKAMFIDDEGHKGSEIAGRVDKLWKEDNLLKYEGVFDMSEAGYESIRLIADQMWSGVSVDVDQAKGEMSEDGKGVTFSEARVSAITICAIPAFAEAYIALGPFPEPEPTPVITEEAEAAGGVETFVSEGSWDGSAGRFTPEQWKKSCILHVCDGLEKSCHKLPIREPGGALSRAGVHAAAARINQVDAPPDKVSAAKSHLRGAYKELGEEAPDVLKAAGGTEAFDLPPAKTMDAPGWITDPVPTHRITHYWVSGPGRAKIGWGAPGDFNRCRLQLAKYVQNPEWLAGLCANLHYRALGTWPGRGTHSGETITMQADEKAEVPSVTLTASAGQSVSADYFRNPELTKPTSLKVTDDGRVFGHIAAWGVCHIGNPEGEGICTVAPPSETDYAYFLSGEYVTDAGRIPVGQISLGGGHADGKLGMRAALAHYDNTSTAVADITVGTDDHGIWFSGKLRDDVTDAQVIALRAAGKVSGDWRGVIVHGQESLELMAALAVNVPGFPIPRTSYAMDGDVQLSLTAAGIPMDKHDVISAEFEEQMEAYNARQERRARLSAIRDKNRVFRLEAIKAKIEEGK